METINEGMALAKRLFKSLNGAPQPPAEKLLRGENGASFLFTFSSSSFAAWLNFSLLKNDIQKPNWQVEHIVEISWRKPGKVMMKGARKGGKKYKMSEPSAA